MCALFTHAYLYCLSVCGFPPLLLIYPMLEPLMWVNGSVRGIDFAAVSTTELYSHTERRKTQRESISLRGWLGWNTKRIAGVFSYTWNLEGWDWIHRPVHTGVQCKRIQDVLRFHESQFRVIEKESNTWKLQENSVVSCWNWLFSYNSMSLIYLILLQIVFFLFQKLLMNNITPCFLSIYSYSCGTSATQQTFLNEALVYCLLN